MGIEDKLHWFLLIFCIVPIMNIHVKLFSLYPY